MAGELQAGDPQSAGPYRLLGRLGAGGMGQVYLGRSAGGRLVAVKVIRPELAGEPGFRVRFAREVAAARNVSGLFTAPVVDADVTGPDPWLATAYVAGPSLADAVGAQGPLPADSVLRLAAALAEALGAIHAAGMVHRDLKPSNVLLAGDGPRVIDFGISRAAEATVLTQSGVVMGSPGFMSPEQAEGRPVGAPSDVFSLGAVLAFAATGEGPFGSGPTPALMYRVVHHPPDTARLPGQIRPLVERCLAKDPDERPTTGELLAELGAAELAADWLPTPLAETLGRYAPTGLAVAAGLGSPADYTVTRSPAAGRSPLPEAALSGPPTQTTAGGSPAPPGTAAPPPPGGTGSRPQRRKRRGLAWVALAAGLIAAAAAAVIAVPRAINDAAATHPRTSAQAGAALSSSPVQSPLTGGSAGRSATPATAGQPSPGSVAGPAGSSPTGTATRGSTPVSSTPHAPTPAAPGSVTATATGQYAIDVSWADSSAGISGFNIDNGCPAGSCQAGATLAKTTGPVTTTEFGVTPGTYQCFRVQAFNNAGTSGWSGYGCTSTPSLTVPGSQEWTDTGVTVSAGNELGITAAGQVYAAVPGSQEGPVGNPSCTPAAAYSTQSAQFPAPDLPCWSLVARIGSGPAFEVGTSILATATSGQLYLGINDDAVSGNTGSWTVNIKLGGLPPPA